MHKEKVNKRKSVIDSKVSSTTKTSLAIKTLTEFQNDVQDVLDS